MVWPLHCEIGSWGQHACQRARGLPPVAERQHRATRHVFKGMNPWTEHYSAVRAEVPDPQDDETGLNTLLARLRQSSTLVIAGEASSHCVRATTEHIVEHWGSNDSSRIVLLTTA
jgi:nicotinamidase-related amidase